MVTFLLIFLKGGFFCIYQFYMIGYIYQHWRFFFQTFPGLMSFILGEIINSTLSLIWFQSYCVLHINISTFIISISLVSFIRLKQTLNLLKNPKELIRNKTAQLNFARFTRYHTQILLDVFATNYYFGTILLAFILVNIVLSSYFIIAIILGMYIKN